MQERPGPEIQPSQAQAEIVSLRKASANWYKAASLFLVLGLSTTIGGWIESEVKRDAAGFAATAIGINLLVGAAAATRFSMSLETRAKMKENTQKAIDEINSS